jgi:hypothetical protein
LFKNLLFIYFMTCRGTSQDILRNSGCKTSLHVHWHLLFRALYNKHMAAVSTGHMADRASDLQLSECHNRVALRLAPQERTTYVSAYLAFAIKAE